MFINNLATSVLYLCSYSSAGHSYLIYCGNEYKDYKHAQKARLPTYQDSSKFSNLGLVRQQDLDNRTLNTV